MAFCPWYTVASTIPDTVQQGLVNSAPHFIKRILTPHFLNPMASYDVASTMNESMP